MHSIIAVGRNCVRQRMHANGSQLQLATDFTFLISTQFYHEYGFSESYNIHDGEWLNVIHHGYIEDSTLWSACLADWNISKYIHSIEKNEIRNLMVFLCYFSQWKCSHIIVNLHFHVKSFRNINTNSCKIRDLMVFLCCLSHWNYFPSIVKLHFHVKSFRNIHMYSFRMRDLMVFL